MAGLDKLTAIWNGIRDSLWFLPALMTAGSVALAIITIQIDVADVLPTAPAGIWLFSGTASGARGVLTAVASGFITVTGVVFSITIVALQLASTQFTPRILRNFTSDRANQVVLGMFIGTFTYALLVLRVVRGEQGGITPEDIGAAGEGATAASTVAAFVPHLSVTVAVVLAILSIGFLIFFIDHAARSVQASVIIDRVTSDALDTLERRFPARVGRGLDQSVDAATPDAQSSTVTAERSGYVQGVDHEALMEILHADDLIVRMEQDIGDYVLPGGALATVWPAGSATLERLEKPIRSAYILGPERTNHLDLELGVIELSDIAVKALSPGVNDPTTAVLCVDRLAEILLATGRQEPPDRVRRAAGEGGVLILPMTEFETMVDTAFDEIRHYGAENPRFARSLLERLGDLGRLLPDARLPPVARQAAALLTSARDLIQNESDLHRVEEAGARTFEKLGVRQPAGGGAGAR